VKAIYRRRWTFLMRVKFTPTFYQACQQVVIERFPDPDEEVGDGDTCPHCGKFNSVPAADTCEHLVGCRWDGQLDIVGGPRDLKAHWDALVEEAAAREDDIAKDVILQVEANKSPALARLIDAAGKGAELFEVLTEIYEVDCGGWSTGGMLGGSIQSIPRI
jgi:hypothetical protein